MKTILSQAAKLCARRRTPPLADKASLWRGATLLAALLLGASPLAAQQPPAALFLRDLSVVRGEVSHIDFAGVAFADGPLVAWPQIESGVVGKQQAQFDKLLADVGDPAYRLQRRLELHDATAAAPLAEKLYHQYAGRRDATAGLVFEGVVSSRIALGKLDACVAPYLELLAVLRRHENHPLAQEAIARLEIDVKTGFSAKLPPLWDDEQSAGQSLAAALKVLPSLKEPRPLAAEAYVASLAVAAGDLEAAKAALRRMPAQDRETPHWRLIVACQHEAMRQKSTEAAERLEAALDDVSASTRPIAIYWLGAARTRSADPATRQEGQLRLLELPALHGRLHPELAAAALLKAAAAVKEDGAAAAAEGLRREVSERYAWTSAARILRRDASTSSSPDR